jgi:ankyrin repeat protein
MDLIYATENGDLQMVTMLLQQGADPNVRDREGYTPLMLTTDPEIIHALIEAGANLNVVSKNKTTALHENYQRPDIVEILLEAGADPNIPSNNVPLFLALDQDELATVELLLKYGADPNHVYGRGNTALEVVLNKKYANIDLVKLLIQWGADVNHPTRRKTYLTMVPDDEEAIRVLLEAGADPYAIDIEGSTEMNKAISGRHYNKVRLLSEIVGVDTPGRDGYTPLMRATFNMNFNMVKLLLELGADPLLEHPKTGETAFDLTDIKRIRTLLTQSVREEAINAHMHGELVEPELVSYIGRFVGPNYVRPLNRRNLDKKFYIPNKLK